MAKRSKRRRDSSGHLLPSCSCDLKLRAKEARDALKCAKEHAEQETEQWKSHCASLQTTADQVPILQRKIKQLQAQVDAAKATQVSNKRPVNTLTEKSAVLIEQVNSLKSQINERRLLQQALQSRVDAQALELEDNQKAASASKRRLAAVEKALQCAEDDNAAMVEKLEHQAALVQRKLEALDNKLLKADRSKARTVNGVVTSVLRLLEDRKVSENTKQRALKQLYEGSLPASTTELRTTPTKQEKHRAKQRLEGSELDTHTYLSGCTSAQLEKVIPPKAQSKLKQQGAQDLADALYLHWNLVQCSHLKLCLKLSAPQWQMLRNVLFRRYQSDGVYTELFNEVADTPEHLANVKFRLPYSAWKLNRYAELVAADLGLDEMLDGHVACVDIRDKLDQDVRADVAAGFFQRITDSHGVQELRSVLNGTGLIIQFLFDAAATVRQRKTTVLAFKIVNGSRDTHKPRYTHSVACSEGGDDWETLTVQLEEPLIVVNDIIKSGQVESDGVEHSCRFLAGADQAGVHSNFGMGSCKEEHACSYCLAPNTTFCRYDTKYPARSLDHFAVLSHTSTGYCTVCEMWIVEEVTDPTTQMKLASAGDRPPSRLRKGWNKRHLNVKYGCSVLIKVEPELWAICLLHLDLRFVGTLVKKTLLRHFDGSSLDEAKAKLLHDHLVKSGIPIGKIRQTSKTTDTFFKSVKNHSFCGTEAITMRSIWRECLDIVFPPDEVAAASAACKDRVQRYIDVWTIYTRQDGVWATLNDLSVEKEAKAVKVESISRKFADIWVLAFNDTPTLYMHLLLHHYPDQIRNLPIDPWFLQLQGLEHNNKIRKQFARLMSNNHKPGNQKVLEIDSYLRSDGKRVKSAARWSGPCMSYVLMKQIILSEHITNLLTTPELISAKMDACRRIKVNARKANVKRIFDNQIAIKNATNDSD